jgi:hypothetical protein
MNSEGEAWDASPLTFYPHVAPESEIEDAPAVYICVNSGWASFIMGRLRILTRDDSWLGDDAERWRATQNIERLLNLMACEDCSEFVTDIRVDENGQLQTKKGGAWGNANGEGGDTTVINNIDNINEQLYPDPAPDPGLSNEEMACNIATEMVDWLTGKFSDMLDLAEASIDSIAAADAILGIFPPLYLAADQTLDIANEIVEASINAMRAALTVTLREEMICLMQSAIDQDGRVTSANYPDTIDSLEDAISNNDPLVILNSFKGTIEAINQAAFISRANQYQSSDAACVCGDCFNNPNNVQVFSPDNPRFTIFIGSYNSADNTIDSVGNVIEVWYSLVADLTGITDAVNIPRVCPFESVGQFSYELNYPTTFLNILITAENIPSGAETLSNFAGNVPAEEWGSQQFSVSQMTDRAAIAFRFNVSVGHAIRLRNLEFNIQNPT